MSFQSVISCFKTPIFFTILGSVSIVISHALFGLNIVFTRSLQHGDVQMPPFLLLCISNLLIFFCYLPFGIYHFYKLPEKKKNVINFFKNWMIYLFAVSMTLLVIFKMFGSKFTSAIYIQLLLQLTPFVVTIVSYFLLKEKIPIFAFVCLFFSVVGGVLVILAGSSKKTENYVFHWLIDWNNLSHSFSFSDLIGIGMGFGAVISLATFVVSVKYATSISKYKVHEFSMLGFGTFFSGIACLILSLVFLEDWTKLFVLNSKELLHFILFLIVTLIALFLDMFAIPIIGASWAASVLAVRLLSTVIFSWPILNEQMDNFWQFVGCVMVCIGVSVFLVYKAWKERKDRQNSQEKSSEINQGVDSNNLEEKSLETKENENIQIDNENQSEILKNGEINQTEISQSHQPLKEEGSSIEDKIDEINYDIESHQPLKEEDSFEDISITM